MEALLGELSSHSGKQVQKGGFTGTVERPAVGEGTVGLSEVVLLELGKCMEGSKLECLGWTSIYLSSVPTKLGV